MKILKGLFNMSKVCRIYGVNFTLYKLQFANEL
jgi:hypothetical protein